MTRNEKITKFYEMREQLIELKKQQLVQNRDKEIEDNFSVLVTGKPKVKALKRKFYTNCQKIA